MRFPRISVVLASLLFLALPALGQSPNGNINGLVLDPASRVITGAEIIAVNDATGVQSTTRTNEEGVYVLVNLPPGPYRLQVSKVGFKTIIRPDIKLTVQDALSLNFTLPVGATLETVTVEGGASLVNTQGAAVSTVIDRKYVENMPLNGRSFQDLILLTPGVVTNSPQAGGAAPGGADQFSVNGQRTDANYYTVDGLSGNMGSAVGRGFYLSSGMSGATPVTTALGTTQSLVSVDALEEFRVQSSTYSAEYGRSPGGQFAFVTRSGSKEWHGSAFEYLRNNVFDANDWFNSYYGLSSPPLRQNDFGGTLGGPIPWTSQHHPSTFFFFSYEALRLVQPQAASVSYVPDDSLRDAAPTALQPVLRAFPVANGSSTGDGLAEFIGAWSNPSSINSYSVRLDHNLGQRTRLFFRFSDVPSRGGSRSGGNAVADPAAFSALSFETRSYTLGGTLALASQISNDFRMNFGSNQARSRTAITAFAGNSPVDLAGLQGVKPEALVAFVFPFGGRVAVLSQNQQAGTQRQWNLIDTVTLVLGHHQLRMGVDYRRLAPTAEPFNPYVQYVYPNSTFVTNNIAVNATGISYLSAHPLYRNFSSFAQDNWQITARLNLSFGLRWEVNPAPGVTQGLMPYTTAGSSLSTLTLAPQGTPLWETTWFNLAPRLGLALTVFDRREWETVLRGGAGVFFDTGQQLGSLGFSGAGFNAVNSLSSVAFPVSPATLVPVVVNPPQAPYSAVYSFPRDLQLPATVQWNASLQQGLGKAQALTLTYLGSHARRLLAETEYSGSALENPNIINLFVNDNRLSSDYNALQLQFQRRLSSGLTALTSYAWSHCSDYGSSNITLGYGYRRGDCDFDVRHNFASALSYDVPSPSTHPIARRFLGHWGIDNRVSLRSSFPVTLRGSQVIDPATGQAYYTGLDSVPGEPTYLRGDACAAAYTNGRQCPGDRAINPAAFALPAAGYGTAGRNSVRGFSAWQIDLAIRRTFGLTDRLKLQFRAEAFNLFNHPSFGTIDPFYGDTTFGQATGSLASTLGVLSPLYQMGGPRSLQVALKLNF